MTSPSGRRPESWLFDRAPLDQSEVRVDAESFVGRRESNSDNCRQLCPISLCSRPGSMHSTPNIILFHCRTLHDYRIIILAKIANFLPQILDVFGTDLTVMTHKECVDLIMRASESQTKVSPFEYDLVAIS